MKKIVLSVLGLLVAGLLLIGCAPPAEAPAGEGLSEEELNALSDEEYAELVVEEEEKGALAGQAISGISCVEDEAGQITFRQMQRGAARTYTDRCATSQSFYNYFCTGDSLSWRLYRCSGGCVSNTCTGEAALVACEDTDKDPNSEIEGIREGKNYGMAGKTILRFEDGFEQENKDECVTSVRGLTGGLREKFCAREPNSDYETSKFTVITACGSGRLKGKAECQIQEGIGTCVCTGEVENGERGPYPDCDDIVCNEGYQLEGELCIALGGTGDMDGEEMPEWADPGEEGEIPPEGEGAGEGDR